MAALPTLAHINAADASAFSDHLGEVFEHAPWVAAAIVSQRPFASVDALHRAMLAAVAERPEDARVALFNGHPELAGAAARLGQMTSDSVREQGGLALGALGAEDSARWDALNAAYRARFGFPFILCITRHTRESALATFETRLAHDRDTELSTTLAEIGRITRLRLAARIADHGLDDVHGRLTTHVLDTSRGRPAEGMVIALYEAGADGRAAPGARPLAEAVTDCNGATAAPLLDGAPLRIGRYEMRFQVGDYYRRLHGNDQPWPFLDIVPIAFAISDAEGDYHVPLTITPWAYGTYRGQ